MNQNKKQSVWMGRRQFMGRAIGLVGALVVDPLRAVAFQRASWHEYICAVGAGTHKIKAVIGYALNHNEWCIVGAGEADSAGVGRVGKLSIYNHSAYSNSIRKAVESAARMAGRDVQSIFVSVMGLPTKTSAYECDRRERWMKDLLTCAEMSGYRLAGFVDESDALTWGTLTDVANEGAICLMDIGAQKTLTVILDRGSPIFIDYLCIGGDSFTKDLSAWLRKPRWECEKLKIRGCGTLRDSDLRFNARSGVLDLETPSQFASIIYARLEEFMIIATNEIKKRFDTTKYPRSVIITGGSAQIAGITFVYEGTARKRDVYLEYLTRRERLTFNPVCRIGGPTGIRSKIWRIFSPDYVIACGTLRYAGRLRSS